MSEAIRQSLEDSIKNYSGQENKTSNKVRMVIWTGPSWDPNTRSVFISRGYYKDTHMVYSVPKNKYNLLISSQYAFSISDLNETSNLLKLNSTKFTDEIIQRVSPSDSATVAGKPGNADKSAAQKASEASGVGFIGQSSTIVDTNGSAYSNLIKLITFFNNEVVLCTVQPGELSNLPGGVPDQTLHEVEAFILPNRSIDGRNVWFVHSNDYPRESINSVPKGGGQPIGSYRSNNLSIDPSQIANSQNGKLSIKIKQYTDAIDSVYNSNNCDIYNRDISLDGDLWWEGVRSSLSNNLYEVWIDDIGGGPMIRASRQAVQQAAARYYKDINPSNQFYNGYRVNPLSTTFASNAITPVKTYIEDLFSDPNFYAGIINVLFAIINGLDESANSSDLYNKSIDLGSLDYQKLYNKYDGVAI